MPFSIQLEIHSTIPKHLWNMRHVLIISVVMRMMRRQNWKKKTNSNRILYSWVCRRYSNCHLLYHSSRTTTWSWKATISCSWTMTIDGNANLKTMELWTLSSSPTREAAAKEEELREGFSTTFLPTMVSSLVVGLALEMYLPFVFQTKGNEIGCCNKSNDNMVDLMSFFCEFSNRVYCTSTQFFLLWHQSINLSMRRRNIRFLLLLLSCACWRFFIRSYANIQWKVLSRTLRGHELWCFNDSPTSCTYEEFGCRPSSLGTSALENVTFAHH